MSCRIRAPFGARATFLYALIVAMFAAALAWMSPAPPARADECIGTWTLGVGGFEISTDRGTWQDSDYFNVNQPVGYHSADPNGGLRELDRLFWQHRSECPGDHIKIIAHSEGAAITHAWVSAHQDVQNANAILLSDPKRAPGPGGAGLSANPLGGFLGYPLAGVDANFGDFPVLSVCNGDDWVCHEAATPYGYAFTGAHGRYDFNVWNYGNWESGVWYR